MPPRNHLTRPERRCALGLVLLLLLPACDESGAPSSVLPQPSTSSPAVPEAIAS